MAGKKKTKKRKGSPRTRKGRGKRPLTERGGAVRLSLCMIAGDGDDEHLSRCLASVAGLVDEAVIGCTGTSPKVSAAATASALEVDPELVIRSIAVPWDGDFAAARNRTLQEARGEWILVLDCDEVIAPSDHGQIIDLTRRGTPAAFRFSTRNYTDKTDRAGWTANSGSHPQLEAGSSGWFPTTKVRLWRRHPQVRFEGVVHELVEQSLQRLGGRIDDCLAPVHHYGYLEGPRDSSRYLEAGEEKVRQQPHDLLARYELAIAYRDAGRLEEGLGAIEHVIEASRQGTDRDDSGYLQEEFVHLVHGDILDRMERQEEALLVYRDVAARFPESHQAFNNMGSILSRRGDLRGARECYERGLALAPDNPVLQDNLARLTRHEADRPTTPAAGEPSHTLSLCVIVRDGAGDLDRCLASVAAAVDDIVVVDTGSTDDSVAVAERHGARVAHFTWCDDFAAARNASLEMATGEWILWMDADDYLLPAECDKVARARRLAPDQALYFTLANEGGSDRTCFRQIKMFPNRPEIRFERPVHETVMPSLRRIGMAVAVTDVEVRHVGYADPTDTHRKHAYYHELMSKWVVSHPEEYDFHFRIGHTHYANRQFAQAREQFELILRAGAEAVQPRSVYVQAATFVGRCLLEMGDHDNAVEALKSALELDAGSVLGHLSMGDALTKSGEYERALPHLRRALSGQTDPHFPQDGSSIRYSAQFFIGQCCEATGHREEALDAYRAAAGIRPDRPEAVEAAALLDRQHPVATGGDAPPPRLSLCMIVRDEEERLGDCLESVRGLCDEIVVVDTGSSDGTIDVAQRYGAVISSFNWCDNFALARNESLRLATGDWIMWLDADDLMPREHHARIRELVSQERDRGYFFVLDDRGYESVSCMQMRLFPNLEGVAFEMPIHEQVTPSLARLGLTTVPTEIKVVHTGYSTPEVVREKKDRYLAIMERWLEGHPEDYLTRSHVALTYHTTGRVEDGAEQYRLIVEESTCKSDRNFVVYTTALLFLGRSYLKMGDLEKARVYMHQAEAVDDEYVLTKLSLAEVYAELGEAARTIEYAEWILGREPQLTFFPIDQGELEYSALCLAGRGYQALGQLDRAAAAFSRAVEVPTGRRAEALGSLSEVHKAAGDREKAHAALRRAIEIEPDSAKHLFNIGMLHLEAGEYADAVDRFRQVLRIKPHYGPAILNLGYIAKQEGRFEDAEGLYRELMELEPSGVEARANLAHLYLDRELFEQAIEAFGEVRTLDGSLLDINLGMLVAQSAAGREVDFGLAGEMMRPFETVAVDLQSPRAAAETFVLFGVILIKENQLKCAEMALTVAVNLVAADTGAEAIATGIRARRCLGEVYYSGNLYWKAIRQYEAILLADPRDGDTFRRLGDCYARLGVDEAARICYDRSSQAAL